MLKPTNQKEFTQGFAIFALLVLALAGILTAILTIGLKMPSLENALLRQKVEQLSSTSSKGSEALRPVRALDSIFASLKTPDAYNTGIKTQIEQQMTDLQVSLKDSSASQNELFPLLQNAYSRAKGDKEDLKTIQKDFSALKDEKTVIEKKLERCEDRSAIQ